MLVDEVIVTVKAGDGGSGTVSFKRNAQTPRGGPDGGSGGKGADVYFRGVDDASLLQKFRYTKEIKTENGVDGGGQNLTGRNGKDLIVDVPLGTLVKDLASGESFEITDGRGVLIAKGGRGGRGNNEFKTAVNQAPKYRELGEKGQERKLKLELKMIADVGVIGLPNSGKSSLLSVLTNAHPKIGDYPFTTLEPNLGVLNGLIIADIPGLIEGSHKGKGLGDKFLRHIERTKILLHCIDSGSEDILKDYEIVRGEMENFNKELLLKKEIIVITKTDNASESKIIEIKKNIKKLKKIFCFTSIYDTETINELKKLI